MGGSRLVSVPETTTYLLRGAENLVFWAAFPSFPLAYCPFAFDPSTFFLSWGLASLALFPARLSTKVRDPDGGPFTLVIAMIARIGSLKWPPKGMLLYALVQAAGACRAVRYLSSDQVRPSQVLGS